MNSAPEPIAIIGIGCHFPGGATSPQAYWDLLCRGVDATREVPANRWDAATFYSPDPSQLGKMGTRRGGFLDDIDRFDPQFFGMSPREAVWIDPQQRLVLRTAVEALDDAGLDANALQGTRAGVYVAGFTLDYQLLQNYGVQSRYELQSHSATGMMMTMLANRLSYSLDLRGPSMAVDTACSGSLVAVHLAVQAIRNGECEVALAGGVNVMLAPNMTIAESKGGFLAADGRCKTFSANADGYGRGEGAGMVVLKPLAAAQADGDPVYAAILGTAVTQDGRTQGITVPSGEAQVATMRAAYAQAGVDPSQVHYVEAHGTGTPVGDPIEVDAIGHVMGEHRTAADAVVVGSAKTNIGHLEAAAGVAGLIKAAMAVRNEAIPGNLHADPPNTSINFSDLGVRVPRSVEPWDQDTRFAGVNSFGFGGTNAHAVLANVPSAPRTAVPEPAPYTPLPVSARSEAALRAAAERMADFLDQSDATWADVLHTAALRHTQHDHRLVVTSRDRATAAQQLRCYAQSTPAEDVSTGHAGAPMAPKVAFVFTGMGPQWWAMGRQLMDEEPVFRAAIERCDRELGRYTGRSLVAELSATESDSRMDQPEVAQQANFAIQVALSELLASWGITPDGVVGHSTGEVAAQYVAGTLTFADAVKVTYYRSSLQQRATGQGRMLAVGLTPETLDRAVADAGPLVSVAAVNSPRSVTLAGDAAVLESMAAQMETFGVFHRFLDVQVPYHSHFMDPLRDDLLNGLEDLNPRRATLPLYSTVTGSQIDGDTADAHYWWQNVRATVLFQSAFTAMVEDGYTHFVQVGPHPVLSSSMREVLADLGAQAAVLATLKRGTDESHNVRQVFGALHCAGGQVQWTSLLPQGGRHTPLPSYPWQLGSYWNESREAREDRYPVPGSGLLGRRVNALDPTWDREVSLTGSFLADHVVQGVTLMPAAAFVEMGLQAAHQIYGRVPLCLEQLHLKRALVLGGVADPRTRTTLLPDSGCVGFASFHASADGGRTWVDNATARVTGAATRPDHVDVSAAITRASSTLSREAFYAITREMGFEYGPAFQTVTEVALGASEVVGRIQVPSREMRSLQDYVFHPSMVDAALQILLVAGARQRDATGSTYLPTSIDRISVLGQAQTKMVALATIRHADDRSLVSDIVVTDEAGQPLLHIEGFNATSLDAVSVCVEPALHKVRWVLSPSLTDKVPAEKQRWLLISDHGGVSTALAAQLRSAGHSVSEATAADVEKALTDHVFDRVVHLASLDQGMGTDSKSLSGVIDGVIAVASLVQRLSSHPNLARLTLVTRAAVPAGDCAVDATGAPLWGIGRVIGHQELPAQWGGLIDLPPVPPEQAASMLWHELLCESGEDQVALRPLGRYVARLAPLEHTPVPIPGRVRPEAGYLVTGGLGALGMVAARQLHADGARHIILTGRRCAPPAEQWPDLSTDHPLAEDLAELASWRAAGTEVDYAQMDASDAAALAAWHDEYRRAGRPPIAGVVHTAGIVDDQLLTQAEPDRLRRVMDPKIHGAWNLHQEFGPGALDFMVLFSSTGSVIASPGQAAYAAGNAFMDALAVVRSQAGEPTTSVSWGPWSVGMVASLHLEQMYARKGISLIVPAAGALTLRRMMGAEEPHVVAVTVDWDTAAATSASGTLPPMFSELCATPEAGAASNAFEAAARKLVDEVKHQDIEKALQGVSLFLRDALAHSLQLDADTLDVNASLSGLGIDSLIAVELKNRVEGALSVDVSVLDLMQGASVRALAAKVLDQLRGHGSPAPTNDPDPGPARVEEIEALLAGLDASQVEQLLSELEGAQE